MKMILTKNLIVFQQSSLVFCLWKFNKFQTFLASTLGKFKSSVIDLRETWNKPANLSFDLTNYHPLHFTVRDKQGLNRNAGGGVRLWVKKSLCFEPINSISIFLPRVFESHFIKIKNGKNKYTVVFSGMRHF